MANSVDPDQTAPAGAVCSGYTLFASILNSSVKLGNYLQQTASADDIFRCIFFLALKGLKHYWLRPSPASHNFRRLLTLLLIFLDSLFYKHYGPRSDCSHGSSLIRFHSVCFHDKI